MFWELFDKLFAKEKCKTCGKELADEEQNIIKLDIADNGKHEMRICNECADLLEKMGIS